MIKRSKTLEVMVGDIVIGGDNPIVVQSMTNTNTSDINASFDQVRELYEAGSEIVRLTVDTKEAAIAIPKIKDKLLAANANVPLVGDFHYNGHTLLGEVSECAEALDKYRINPGNVGQGKKRDLRFSEIIEIAIKYDKPVRIGVNWGSLDQELLKAFMDKNINSVHPKSNEEVMRKVIVASALDSAKFAEELGLGADKIIISAKVSEVMELVEVYRDLSKQCDYPLHLGLTEAGMGLEGVIASTSALAILLEEGIGDTIRVSITPKPGEKRSGEVLVAREILQSLNIRPFKPKVSACPGCGRTSSSYFQELTVDIKNYIDEKDKEWRAQYPEFEKLKIAVMGCIVNGPGESEHADIGISLPGNGENSVAPVFADGRKIATLRGGDIADNFKQIIDDCVKNRWESKVV